MVDLVAKLILDADADGLVSGTNKADQQLDKLGDSTKSAGKEAEAFSLTSLVLGGSLKYVAAAAAGLTSLTLPGFLYQSAKAANEANLSQARLTSVLRATGNSAGLTSRQINDLADELARTTLFDDDAIRNGEAVLASFRNVQGDTYREGLKLAADLSSLLGTDLQSAIIQVGKALNDPREGITALSRAGVTFSAAQEQQIRNFQDTNQLAKAQGIVLNELRHQFGGTAAELNNADNGARRLTKSWDELLETIGNTDKVSGGARSLFNLLANASDVLRESLEKTQSAAALGIGGQLQPLAKQGDGGLLGGVTVEEYKAKLGAFATEQKRIEEATEARRIANSEREIEREREKMQGLAALYTKFYDDTRTPQEKFFQSLEAITALEKVYGAELASRAAQAAGRQFIDDTAASPQGQQQSAFEASQGKFQEQAATRLADLDLALQTENERVAAAYEARLFIVEDAFNRGLINEQRYQELSTQVWAEGEAQKSRVLQTEIDARMAYEERANQSMYAARVAVFNAAANLFGVFAGKSKAAALAQLAITKGIAIFEILANSSRGAALALATIPPPFGATTAASILAWGKAQAAIVGIGGIAGAVQINQGNFSGGGAASPITNTGSTSPSGNSPLGTADGGGGNRNSGGVTQVFVSGDTFGRQQVLGLVGEIIEGVKRGDVILIPPDSLNAEILRGAP